jgi:CRISPR-associated endonuclease/helicase Cas3
MGRGSGEQEPLAHSAPDDSMSPDPYVRHVESVRRGARERAEEMLVHATKAPEGFLSVIDHAATFHDFGKLDPDTQTVLRKGRGGKLKWDHIDAGVAHLSVQNHDWAAAWLVRGHHAPGFPQKAEHFTENSDRRLRGRRNDDDDPLRHHEQIVRTNSFCQQYLDAHEAVVGRLEIEPHRPFHGLSLRLALSCLVDADHADTAFFDTGECPPEAPERRWAERLESLVGYVKDLPQGESEEERARNRNRDEFFQGCLDSKIDDLMVACQGNVGLGKTTSVTAYLMRRARDENLRRLIVVAPYTNILTQTAKTLREALVLPGENPEEVVVEHHHRADFSRPEDRALAALWRAPVVLTTSVSFFEMLSSCCPSSLRKLNAVPGSAVYLDEAHAALPAELWPQNWKWLRQLAADWGCRFVFASGSLARFWEDDSIVEDSMKLSELLPVGLKCKVQEAEHTRVRFDRVQNGRVLDIDGLIKSVQEAPGPRLVILNTVQNAAVIARAMRTASLDVLHMSTALTPNDREIILKRITNMLKIRDLNDWTLVATSCIEAGLDLSFRTAFRERFSTASIIQVGGRVNRHGEHDALGGGTVYDFSLDDIGITKHPAASVSSEVLKELMAQDALNNEEPADIVTSAMRDEIRRLGGLPLDLLMKAERERDYPRAKEHGRVIKADTRFVVIDPDLKEKLERHERVGIRVLLEGSVQLWSSKVLKLGLEKLHGHAEVYFWNDNYDPDFLGYMSGVLRNEQFMRDSEAWII